MKIWKVSIILILALIISASTGLCGSVVKNPDSNFGIITLWGDMKEAGVKWVRCGAGCTAMDWGAVEKERGVFDWTNADREVYSWTENHGVDLLPIFGYTPAWASSGPKGENNYPPKDLADWSNYVYAIVDRYKDTIKYWEVWNEPDIGFWRGTIEEYVHLMKSAYVAAKKADPECKIVFGGTAGVNIPFIERVYQNGGKYYFDVMAVHPYQWGDVFQDEWYVTELRNLYDLMKRHGDGHKEIWLTEVGWSTGDSKITEELQARLLVQMFVTSATLRDVNVTKTFWFSAKDWGNPGYGIHRVDGSRKPSFYAYRFVSDALEGADFLGSMYHNDLRCYIFHNDGKKFLAAWSPDKETYTLTLPDDISWTDYHKLGGERKPLGEKTLEIGHDPVFIFSDTSAATPKRIEHPEPSAPFKLDVWYSVIPPKETARFFITRGQESGVQVRVHNDSTEPVSAEINGRIGFFNASAKTEILQPGETQEIELVFSLPPVFKSGLDNLSISGKVGNETLAPTVMPIRVADGPVIEFLANSKIENMYLVENKGSAGAPSVRFYGTWTYKFDLSNAKGASLELCVGAHEANPWAVLLSSDQTTWKTALSGRSVRSWHKIDVSEYAGGDLFVKFEGDNQQLSELILIQR